MTTPLARWVALSALACACRSEPAAHPTAPAPAPKSPERTTTTDWKAAFRYEIRHDADRSAVVVDMQVADGFHVYTEGETIGKPLKLTMSEESEFEIDGAVRYPEGETKDLPIGRSVIVEGDAEIVAPVRPKSEGDAANVAAGRFRYQVCTDEACDRPRTETFEISVSR